MSIDVLPTAPSPTTTHFTLFCMISPRLPLVVGRRQGKKERESVRVRNRGVQMKKVGRRGRGRQERKEEEGERNAKMTVLCRNFTL